MAEKFQTLPKVMPCPYHGCMPEYSEHVVNQWISWHIWRCEECSNCNPTPDKHNAFGYGYSSQTSKSAALANWNKAVHRRQMRMLKNAIKNGV